MGWSDSRASRPNRSCSVSVSAPSPPARSTEISTATVTCCARRYLIAGAVAGDSVSTSFSPAATTVPAGPCIVNDAMLASVLCRVQVSARRTAARASTLPKPRSALYGWSPPFQSVAIRCAIALFVASVPGATARALAARISCTSRYPRRGLACSISATTPDTIGAAAEVPLKNVPGASV